MEEEEDDHEELIKRTQEVLQHHRGVSSEIRQQGRSPLPQQPPYPPKKIKNGTEPGRQSILEACKGEICKAG